MALDLLHTSPELLLGFVSLQASVLGIQQPANVADGRLVGVDIGEPSGQPSGRATGSALPTLQASLAKRLANVTFKRSWWGETI